MRRRLDSPAPGWKYDLPEPNDSPSMELYTNLISNPPNSCDAICLELARSTLKIRGLVMWLAIILLPFFLVAVYAFLSIITNLQRFPAVIALASLVSVIVPFWSGVYFWRMDTNAPRDEPIRFNRARRKVYVYRFYHNWLRPLSRTAWYCRAEAYNWDDLRAEACSIYGPMGSGGLIETVTLAVVAPGTNTVLDRFHFAFGIQQGEMYWAMAQRFMQQGADSIPTFEYLPRDWNNEDVTLNLARYLAPKVKWPKDMDLESRTAPSENP